MFPSQSNVDTVATIERGGRASVAKRQPITGHGVRVRADKGLIRAVRDESEGRAKVEPACRNRWRARARAVRRRLTGGG